MKTKKAQFSDTKNIILQVVVIVIVFSVVFIQLYPSTANAAFDLISKQEKKIQELKPLSDEEVTGIDNIKTEFKESLKDCLDSQKTKYNSICFVQVSKFQEGIYLRLANKETKNGSFLIMFLGDKDKKDLSDNIIGKGAEIEARFCAIEDFSTNSLDINYYYEDFFLKGEKLLGENDLINVYWLGDDLTMDIDVLGDDEPIMTAASLANSDDFSDPEMTIPLYKVYGDVPSLCFIEDSRSNKNNLNEYLSKGGQT